jgi:hypothetical protein
VIIIGSEKSKIKKLPELIYGRSLRVEKIKKNQKTKGSRRHLSLPQEAVVAPTTLPKKR